MCNVRGQRKGLALFYWPHSLVKTMHFSARALVMRKNLFYLACAMLRNASHMVARMVAHIVWVTKYRYHVLTEDVQKRCREILLQVCDSEYVKILI